MDHHHEFDQDVGLDDDPQGGLRAERTDRRGTAEAASGRTAREDAVRGLEGSEGREVEARGVPIVFALSSEEKVEKRAKRTKRKSRRGE